MPLRSLPRNYSQHAIHGVGLGLRNPHFGEILRTRPTVPWFEVLCDNYMNTEGQPLAHLEQVRSHYPVTLHGVGMSLGSVDALDMDYLARLKRLAQRLEPTWISDHLAWISVNGRYLHELMPFPYTAESLAHVAERIMRVQDYLGRRILVENPSAYLKFNCDEMSEWEFISALVERCDCHLLIDVNNIYVSAQNNGFDAETYLRALPRHKVREIHLAGYEDHGAYLFDTHGHPVHPPVWELYRRALQILGPLPTLIEWDTDVPDFPLLLQEAARAQQHMESASCPI